jgi:hypothetical protein
LGEFSPNGRYFTLGSFIKIAEVDQNFWLLFSQVLVFALILTKNGVGYILGDLGIISSGHPDPNYQTVGMGCTDTGLPDFSCFHIPILGKYTELPLNLFKGPKIYKIDVRYTKWP